MKEIIMRLRSLTNEEREQRKMHSEEEGYMIDWNDPTENNPWKVVYCPAKAYMMDVVKHIKKLEGEL